jgi:hypothetical protein
VGNGSVRLAKSGVSLGFLRLLFLVGVERFPAGVERFPAGVERFPVGVEVEVLHPGQIGQKVAGVERFRVVEVEVLHLGQIGHKGVVAGVAAFSRIRGLMKAVSMIMAEWITDKHLLRFQVRC